MEEKMGDDFESHLVGKCRLHNGVTLGQPLNCVSLGLVPCKIGLIRMWGQSEGGHSLPAPLQLPIGPALGKECKATPDPGGMWWLMRQWVRKSSPEGWIKAPPSPACNSDRKVWR